MLCFYFYTLKESFEDGKISSLNGTPLIWKGIKLDVKKLSPIFFAGTSSTGGQVFYVWFKPLPEEPKQYYGSFIV
jgi:hypothetical protein